MSDSNVLEEIEQGKAWVADAVQTLAESYGLAVETRWSNARDGFDRRLTLYIGGKAHSGPEVIFTAEELSDVRNTPEVQEALRERLKRFLRSLAPEPKRIGF